jgi:hypothetical protein
MSTPGIRRGCSPHSPVGATAGLDPNRNLEKNFA